MSFATGKRFIPGFLSVGMGLGGMLLAGGRGAAWAGDGQIDIASLPCTISASGSYVVVKNLTLDTTNQDGITIAVDDVTLDLNGHTLTGPGKTAGSSGSGIAVSGEHTNITIRNGTIRDWRSWGVEAGVQIGCRVEYLVSRNNGSAGLILGSRGLAVGNLCLENGGSGIYVGSCSRLYGNTSCSNGGMGLSTLDACVVEANTCWNNGGDGICANHGCVVTGNTCYSNGDRGIYSPGFSRVFDNVACQNGMYGIGGGGNLSITGNVCSQNAGDGICVHQNCTVTGNTCGDNGLNAGDGAGIHATHSGNEIRGNLCVENDRGIDLDQGDNIVSGNVLRLNTTPIEAVAGNQLDILVSELPYTILYPGTYRLTGDLALATVDAHGITVSCDDVTLDLGGHTLTGPGKAAGGDGCGIYLSPTERFNISIRNGGVRRWGSQGIRANAGKDCRYEAVRCVDNGSTGLKVGTACTVTDCTASGNGGYGLETASMAQATGNVCRENAWDGIRVGDGSTVTGNTSDSNTQRGIGSGAGCTMTDNTCSGNGQSGILGSAATIAGNTCRRNGTNGIQAGEGSTIRGNTCSGNTTNGIHAEQQCRVTENTCSDNTEAGILVHFTVYTNLANDVENNLCTGNTTGIDCNPATGNAIHNNRASENTTDFDIAHGNNQLNNLSF